MDTYYTIEEKYLQAVEEVCYGESPKALNLLNTIIENDPFYARAHYQIGKLYYYELKDYKTAGYHFKTCIALESLFPDVYFHFLQLVVFMNMEIEVEQLILKALQVPGIDKASILELQALFFEKNKKWAKALETYHLAFFEATNKNQLENIE
jgi:tetratricopeptide (TPR) repeat protein